MTLLLTQKEVESVMSLDEAIDVIREAIAAEATGAAVAMGPVMLPLPGSALRVVVGAIGGPGEPLRMGLRFNKAGRVAASSAPPLAALFDEDSGDVLCLLAFPFGPTRIAATLAVATQVLSTTDASTVGIVGTGRNARHVLEAVVRQRPVTQVRAFGPHAGRRATFVADMAERLGIPVVGVDSARGAVEGADIVIVGTSSSEPVIHGGWLSRTQLLLSYGQPGEVASTAHQHASRVVVACKKHETAWSDPWHPDARTHPIHNEIDDGHLTWAGVVDLGDVLLGHAPARETTDGLIVFKESEGGYGDVALASRIYDSAVERSLGTAFDFS